MSLEGTWYNQIGEIMKLEVRGSSLTGTYQNPFIEGTYPLVGHVDPAPTAVVRVLSYTLRFINDEYNLHFVTGQSGQLITVDGEEEIVVQWLTTHEAPDIPAALLGWGLAKEPWTYFTDVGQDVFKRTLPAEADIAEHVKAHPLEHPIAADVGFLRRLLSRLALGFVKAVLRWFPPRSETGPLDGLWYNQVGEKMELAVDGASLTGTYQNPLVPGVYPLVGHADPAPFSSVRVLSFTVGYFGSQGDFHLVESSSGQLVRLEGADAILVQWVSTLEAPDLPGAWNHFTLVGFNTFRRTPPSKAEVEANLKRSPRALGYKARR